MNDKRRPESDREHGSFRAEWLDELVRGAKTSEDVFGPDGIFTRLKSAVVERMLEAELTEHLGYEKNGRGGGNRRNGHTPKRVETDTGPVDIRVPRDRDGSFEPRVVPKHARRIPGFDQKVLALYARGMTTRDIQAHLEEMYGTDVSPDLISRVTDSVLDELEEWRQRPLETVYPVVYVDALYVNVRDGGHVRKKAVYVVLGVGLDGCRDVLGLWLEASEGARYWLSVLTELRNRGVQDIFFLCADGLSGMPEAVAAAFPKTVFQTCIVHLIRASLRYVTPGDRRDVIAALRPIYAAANEAAADAALRAFEQSFGAKYPAVVRLWRSRWNDFTPFLAYPAEVRRILYTTNAIESLIFQLRRVLKPRGHFPNDDAVMKLLFLAIRNAQHQWKPNIYWSRALAHFSIMFEGRIPV